MTASCKRHVQPGEQAELSNVAGYQTFRQVASAGSFEGYTTSDWASVPGSRSGYSPWMARAPDHGW